MSTRKVYMSEMLQIAVTPIRRFIFSERVLVLTFRSGCVLGMIVMSDIQYKSSEIVDKTRSRTGRMPDSQIAKIINLPLRHYRFEIVQKSKINVFLRTDRRH
jgi:hypothetical protein